MAYTKARWIALATALISLALTLILVFAFKTGDSKPQFSFGNEQDGYGISLMGFEGPDPSVRLAFGLDGLSLWLFALSSLLMITAIFSSWESVKEKAAGHYALLLALETTLLGIFASLDVVLFYVFFEAMLIPMFFLIGIYGGNDKRKAAVTFFLYTLVGSLLTLLGVIALVVVNHYYGNHKLTFSIPELTSGLAKVSSEWGDWDVVYPWHQSPQVLIFLLLFAGFAIKVPMFPFHTWLPLAHVQAPTAGSVLLAGVMLKVGGYGFIRFNMAMTPDGAERLLPTLAFLSVAGVIYGALTALAQSDMKRLVAYSSISHMGLIVLGIFSATAVGLEGGVIQMINHGLTTAAPLRLRGNRLRTLPHS